MVLEGFRNYKSFFSHFSPGINFIYGKNGQGKTNLIESLYVLTHLKSFRTARLRELYTFESDSAFIQSQLTKQGVSHEVVIGLYKNQKTVHLDQKKVNYTSDYIKNFFSILFSPDQLVFFKEYPLERRNFFDRVLVLMDQYYFRLVKEFNRVKKQKGILLRNNGKHEIFVWNQLLAKIIPDITKLRQSLVSKINKILPDIFRELTGRKERLELCYRSDLEGKTEIEENSITEFLQSKLDNELTKGYLFYGPHKDQFWMTLDGLKDNVSFSQGEYRISFLALQFSINQLILDSLRFSPIILLDDIFSELDQQVFRKTIEYIEQRDNQVFISSTMIPPELKSKGTPYFIQDGQLVS